VNGYAKHAEVNVPSVNDWEKVWKKIATSRTTKVAAGGFSIVVGFRRANKLTMILFTCSNALQLSML
jgi:hypothetical protein